MQIRENIALNFYQLRSYKQNPIYITSSNKNKFFGNKPMDWLNQLPKVNNKFKFQLFGRNVENLNSCYANIQKFDPKDSRSMSPHAFNLYLNSFGVFLTTQQIRIIKEVFSQGDNILYLDFIQNVRNDISPKRKAVIDHAFLELTNGRDVIPISELLQTYDAKNHPYVRTMLKTAQKVYEDFQQAILSRSADRKNFNEVEFVEYLLDVNACVPLQREEFFIDIVLNGFRINDNRVTIDRIKQMEVLLYEKVRQRTYIKKDQGIKSQNAFRFFDMQDKGFVDYERFKKTLEKLGCGFSEKETRAFFEKHANEDLLISYEKMCALFFEMGSGLLDNKNPIYEISKKDGFITSPGMTLTKKIG